MSLNLRSGYLWEAGEDVAGVGGVGQAGQHIRLGKHISGWVKLAQYEIYSEKGLFHP